MILASDVTGYSPHEFGPAMRILRLGHRDAHGRHWPVRDAEEGPLEDVLPDRSQRQPLCPIRLPAPRVRDDDLHGEGLGNPLAQTSRSAVRRSAFARGTVG